MRVSVIFGMLLVFVLSSCGDDAEMNHAPYFVGYDGSSTGGAVLIDTTAVPPEGEGVYSFIIGDDQYGGDQNDNHLVNAPIILLVSMTENEAGVGVSVLVESEEVNDEGQELVPGYTTRFVQFTLTITVEGAADGSGDDTFDLTLTAFDGDKSSEIVMTVSAINSI
ncbi:MAG: hypothetical protein HRU15_12635 [Planctomycetes bacterium]|nr:hypothetical protein [Planctomycetota bacterium]